MRENRPIRAYPPDLTGGAFSNAKMDILELVMPRSAVCRQKFGFSFRLLEGIDNTVGFVTYVKNDSAASRAGLLYGDMITFVNDRRVGVGVWLAFRSGQLAEGRLGR